MEDQDILKIFKTDPKKALGVIFDKYYEYLVREVYFIVKDTGQSEDIVQELFMDLWKKQYLLDSISSSLKYYLKRAAINRSLNKIKQQKFFHKELELSDFNVSFEQNNDNLEYKELENKINSLIDALPNACRTVFVLSRVEQKSYKEIAEELSISIKTVENQISKALKFLRKNLNMDRGRVK